jgi:hypothetical protein
LKWTRRVFNGSLCKHLSSKLRRLPSYKTMATKEYRGKGRKSKNCPRLSFSSSRDTIQSTAIGINGVSSTTSNQGQDKKKNKKTSGKEFKKKRERDSLNCLGVDKQKNCNMNEEREISSSEVESFIHTQGSCGRYKEDKY